MEYRSVIILTLVLNVYDQIDATLNVSPRDTEVKINDSTYLNCSTSLRANLVQWRHGTNYVYTGIAILEPYNERFSVEIHASIGANNLIIRSVQPSDTGKYECSEDEGVGETRSAQLIVLDDDPVCESNAHSDGIIGPNSCGIKPDEVNLSCSVKYHGNVLPILLWKKSGDNESITEGLRSINAIANEVTYTLHIKGAADQMNVPYVCQTTKTSEKYYSCSSNVTNSLYVFSSDVTLNMTMNDEVSCFANSSQTCSYKWKWFNGDDSTTESDDQILKPRKAGWHRCEATCSLGNKSCTVESMRTIVYSDAATHERSPQPLLALILVPVLAVIGVILYCWIKKEIRKTPLDEVDLQGREKDGQKLLDVERRRLDEIELQRREEEERQGREEEERQKLLGMHGHSFEAIDPNPSHGGRTRPDTEQKREEDRLRSLEQKREEDRLRSLGLITTITARKQNEIRGLTILENELFVVCKLSSEVEVYDSTCMAFNLIRQLDLKELIAPLDIVSCNRNKCLYISDYKEESDSNEILKVDRNGTLTKKWPTNSDCARLSVSYESTVVLVDFYENKLSEYSSDGQLIREILLSSGDRFYHLLHAVKLTNGHFLVSHGFGEVDKLHRVCKVDADGKLLKSFGGNRGSGIGQTYSPAYLAVDESGSVMVADYNNDRVLLLGSDLEFKAEILSYEHGLRSPDKILLDESNSRLYVSELERILIFDLPR